MATLQARFILFAFAVMAGAISYNAIFLQEGRHPAPMAENAAPANKTAQPTRTASPRKAKVLPRHDRRPEPVVQKAENVLSIQRHLAENGYEPGPADGVLGEQTRAAIVAYQHDHKMQISGEPTPSLLKSLILGSSTGPAADDPGPMPEKTVELIKSVQKTLKKLGYEPGPVDGLIGSSTADAIRKFEKDHKLPVKGRISGRLVAELKQASGGRLSVIASN